MTLRRRGAPDVALEPLLTDRFQTARGQLLLLTFVRKAGGAVISISVDTRHSLNVEVTRVTAR